MRACRKAKASFILPPTSTYSIALLHFVEPTQEDPEKSRSQLTCALIQLNSAQRRCASAGVCLQDAWEAEAEKLHLVTCVVFRRTPKSLSPKPMYPLLIIPHIRLKPRGLQRTALGRLFVNLFVTFLLRGVALSLA